MNLECEGRLGADPATEADIRKAFADDEGRGEFIILTKADHEYLQAAGDGSGPFDLEYREGGEDQHFRATDEPTREQAETCFLNYLNGNTAWKTAHTWEPLNLHTPKSWWKFW